MGCGCGSVGVRGWLAHTEVHIMALNISDIHEQLQTDFEAVEQCLLDALARGDTKAIKVWQATRNAAKNALDAVELYAQVLGE